MSGRSRGAAVALLALAAALGGCGGGGEQAAGGGAGAARGAPAQAEQGEVGPGVTVDTQKIATEGSGLEGPREADNQ